MNKRSLGASGIPVSEIGFGAWGIGGQTPNATSYGKTDDATSRRALCTAFENGITFFDTAYPYGNGRSETLIGETLTGIRDEIVIATKGGCVEFGRPLDFSTDALRRSLDSSLTRLRTSYVDLYQLHSPPPAVMMDGEPLRRLAEELRRDGLIRAFGVSVAAPKDGLVALREFDLDSIQANFSLVDQRCIDCGLFDAAAVRNVAIIARTPLCFGLLSGAYSADTVFQASDHRSRWPRRQIECWVDASTRFNDAISGHGQQSGAQFALRYCLSFPAVATTIPGMLTDSEVVENAAASGIGAIAAHDLAEIRRIYQGESFFLDEQPG